MSKRNERKEAERLARRQAYLESRNQVSQSQLVANQANAQLSTGPVTGEGKAISSRNHTTHGLTATNFQVLPTENQSQYNRNLADFQAEWKPQTATEHDLVNRLVMHQWLRLRAQRLQESLFSPETGELTDTRKFELYRRYETTHERGFNKALADIQRLRAFQLRQQNGFESQRRKNEEHVVKMQRLQSGKTTQPTLNLASTSTPSGPIPDQRNQ